MSTAKRAGLRALYTVGCLVTSTVLQLAAAYGQRQALIFIPADGRAPVVQNAEFSNGPALHTIVDKTAIRAEVLIFLKSGSKHELLTTAALPAGDLIQGQVPLRSRGIVTLTRSLKTAACSEQPGGARTVRFIYFEVSVESELGMPFEERWIEQEPLQSRRFRDYRAFGEASGGLPVLSEQGPLSERARILESPHLRRSCTNWQRNALLETPCWFR